MDICLIIKGTCNNLIESGIKRHNPDPKIKGYLLQNLITAQEKVTFKYR
jgi:hypothetical protein